MTSRPPTPTQVHAHRFAVRRLESALVGRDPTLRRDAPRRQARALTVGTVLGLVVLLGFTVVGLVRGDADWRGAVIVRGTPSGSLYAVAHEPDRLVPVLNLASARLLAAVVRPPGPDDPGPSVTVVRDDDLADAPRTAPAGIVGAPAVLPDPGAPPVHTWAVCDVVTLDESVPDPSAAAERTTVVLGGTDDTGDTGRVLAPDEALLLRLGETYWLVFDGRRARFDPFDGSLMRGLGLVAGPPPRPSSAALVASLPEAPALAPVVVAGAGVAPLEPSTAALGSPVGGVVTADGARFFLVATDGVQEVPPVVAQIARFANPLPGAGPGIVRADPAALAAAPRTAIVDTDAYPASFPRVAGYDDAGGTVACSRTGPSGTVVTIAPDPTPSTTAVTPWPPEEAGEVSGAHVAGAGVYTRPDAGPPGGGGLLVDPTGRAFPVPDAATAAALGLGVPEAVPPEVLGLLPRGPVLDVASAQIAR